MNIKNYNKYLEKNVRKMNKIKNSIHYKIISQLEKRLIENPFYYNVERNKEYCFKTFNKANIDGEIDLMATHNRNLFIFEIKSNDSQKNQHKAIKQLKASRRKYENSFNKIFTFYVTPNEIKYMRKNLK